MAQPAAVRALLSTGQVWIRGVEHAGPARRAEGALRFAELAGRLVELRGRAAPTVAAGWVAEAQRAREPAAWVTLPDAAVFPPDLAGCGVDLDALAVIRVEDGGALAKAADRLLRSGAFGLVVADFASGARDDGVALSVQSRLASLAKRHGAAVVGIVAGTRAGGGFGAFTSLRIACERERVGAGRYACRAEVVKDRRGAPGRRWSLECRGALGVC